MRACALWSTRQTYDEEVAWQPWQPRLQFQLGHRKVCRIGRPLGYLTFRDLGKLIYPLQSKALRRCKMCKVAVTERSAGTQGNVRFRHRRRSQVDPVPAAVFGAMPTLRAAENAPTEICSFSIKFPDASGGFRIQRDSDSSACPNVVCSNCGAAFRREHLQSTATPSAPFLAQVTPR